MEGVVYDMYAMVDWGWTYYRLALGMEFLVYTWEFTAVSWIMDRMASFLLLDMLVSI